MNINGNSIKIDRNDVIFSPLTSTPNAFVRFADTDGNTVKDSNITFTDAGVISGLTGIDGSLTTNQTTFNNNNQLVSKGFVDSAISTNNTTLDSLGAGSDVYKGLNGTVHEFKSLTSSSKLSLTDNVNDIGLDLVEANIVH